MCDVSATPRACDDSLDVDVFLLFLHMKLPGCEFPSKLTVCDPFFLLMQIC